MQGEDLHVAEAVQLPDAFECILERRQREQRPGVCRIPGWVSGFDGFADAVEADATRFRFADTGPYGLPGGRHYRSTSATTSQPATRTTSVKGSTLIESKNGSVR